MYLTERIRGTSLKVPMYPSYLCSFMDLFGNREPLHSLAIVGDLVITWVFHIDKKNPAVPEAENGRSFKNRMMLLIL